MDNKTIYFDKFICEQCELLWPIWYKASGKKNCKACSEWKKASQRDRYKQDYDAWIKVSFWNSYLAELRKEAKYRSLHVCGYCHKELPNADMCKNGVECKKCKVRRTLNSRAVDEKNKEKRRDERRRAAEKQNKRYRTLEEYNHEIKLNRERKKFVLLLKKHLKNISPVAQNVRWPSSGICWLWNKPGISSAEKFRIRYRLDAEFNISVMVKAATRRALHRSNIGWELRYHLKKGSSVARIERLLGYTVSDLRRHLERQFTEGMTWNNFFSGQIHIDHIIPQSSFNLQDDDQWRKCWCLSNLRPIWASENRRKSNKIIFLL